MPGPLRIEYENACYHVMNRGRSHLDIVHEEKYYQSFLNTLAEAHKRFGIQIQSYCLMQNHYLGKAKAPQWLYPQEVLAQLNTDSHVSEKYQAYVAQGIDEELKQFYDKGNIVP